MPPRILDRRMKRRESLHKNLALHIAPPRPARHLGEQLKRPFSRPKIRHVQTQIRIDHPDQRDILEVQTLRDHLRADQDVDLPRLEVAQRPPVIILPLHQIRIHPLNPRLRKQLPQRLLHPLRPHPRIPDRRIPALRLRTDRRHLRRVPAHMARQLVVLAVKRQRHAAIRALRHITAFWTLQRTRITPPVQEQHRLLRPLQPLGDCLLQLRGKNRHPLLPPRRLSHVHHPHNRHLLVIRPRRHLQQGVLPVLGVEIAFHRRSRRTQHHHRIFHPPPDHGHIPRMITRCLLLLVRMLVLLVHDHQPQRLHRCKNRRPRANHNPRPALPDLVPFIVPLPGGKVAVQNRHQRPQRPRAETRLETLHRLRCQRNLRHQHDGPPALLQRMGNRLQIYLRLAASRHPVQQEDRRTAALPALRSLTFRLRRPCPIHRRQDGRQRPDLLRVQRQRLRRQNLLIRVGIALRHLGGDRHHPLVLQSPQCLPRRPRRRQQLLQRHLTLRPQQRQHFLLAPRQLGHLARRSRQSHHQSLTPARLLLPHRLGQDALQRNLRRTAVVIRNPPGQLQHPRRHERWRSHHPQDGPQVRMRRMLHQRRHAPRNLPRTKGNFHPRPHGHLGLQFRRNDIIELLPEGDFQRYASNHPFQQTGIPGFKQIPDATVQRYC